MARLIGFLILVAAAAAATLILPGSPLAPGGPSAAPTPRQPMPSSTPKPPRAAPDAAAVDTPDLPNTPSLLQHETDSSAPSPGNALALAPEAPPGSAGPLPPAEAATPPAVTGPSPLRTAALDRKLTDLVTQLRQLRDQARERETKEAEERQ